MCLRTASLHIWSTLTAGRGNVFTDLAETPPPPTGASTHEKKGKKGDLHVHHTEIPPVPKCNYSFISHIRYKSSHRGFARARGTMWHAVTASLISWKAFGCEHHMDCRTERNTSSHRQPWPQLCRWQSSVSEDPQLPWLKSGTSLQTDRNLPCP